MSSTHSLTLLILLAAVGASRAQEAAGTPPDADRYLPKLRVEAAWTNSEGKALTGYRFTQAQLAEMATTRLETNRFRAYVERRWPIERLRTHCVATNALPERYQNLVALNCPIRTDLHPGKATSFDRVWVYVSEDDGHGTYIEEAGTRWHRWKYSLNAQRGKKHWVIIETLPNDFMDSRQSGVGEPDAAPSAAPPHR